MREIRPFASWEDERLIRCYRDKTIGVEILIERLGRTEESIKSRWKYLKKILPCHFKGTKLELDIMRKLRKNVYYRKNRLGDPTAYDNR